MQNPVIHYFDFLEPMHKLSASRRAELAQLCFIEQVDKDIDPFRMNVSASPQAIYLLKGNLGLRFQDQRKVIARGGSSATRHPVNASFNIKDSLALTDIEILRVDLDLLDIMMTWDQLSTIQQSASPIAEERPTAKTTADWMKDTHVFSAFHLQQGLFSRIPPTNIEAIFNRMTAISTVAGQVIIQQGAEGDYYYLINHGAVAVTKVIDHQPPVTVATLHAGSAFGEEALVSDNKRNATVTMLTDGELLRLNKQDFIALLKAPLIKEVNLANAKTKVEAGAIWVDVRLPSEYAFDHISQAINLPLSELRDLAISLDASKEYIVYCQTGRRSAAAAFILAQYGLNALVLAGGTRHSAVYA